MLKYHASYRFARDAKVGRYCHAEVLDFPGVITFGKTLDRARLMLADALQLMAECLLEDGEPLPKPNTRRKGKKGDILEPIYLSIRASAKPRARLSA